ncbi:SEC14-like protein 2 [Araneus ventricosus]|uniref:SEC14-like protein 2 n=1 Tax=Araneus ventricosus TaxID=182803 RepID=A0A4Y2F0R2_ARAVE|nr:SEC14-like protein 2 [Araneus ventricosus]
MAPTNAKSLMKDFRASFRRKKATNPTPKIDAKQLVEEEEQAKLAELKENLARNIPSRYDDSDLMAFLRARSLNVKEAEKLMKVDFNLRKFLQMEEFLKGENHPQILLNSKYSVSGIIGFDNEGTLVRVINIGYSDAKGFISVLSTMDHFKLFLWYIERDLLLQKVENMKTGNKKNQIAYILNMEHLSMSKLMDKTIVEAGLMALKLLQDHYHDVVKVVYVVNAPSYFSSVFKLFKPVIKEALHQSIKVLDSNWKEELLKHIDADVLPVYLGGNRVDCTGDPECGEFIGFGGTIDDDYYPADFLDPDDPEVVSVNVPAGSSLFFRYSVPEVGTILRWHIQSKDNDIGIGVFLDTTEGHEESAKEGKQKKKREEDVSKMEPLTPPIRLQCHLCPEIGETAAWFSGSVVLQLDNTYSWMSAKEVMMKIIIEQPREGATNNKKVSELTTKTLQKPTRK